MLERTQLYAEELGIDLPNGTDRELFKWFRAMVLFGGRAIEVGRGAALGVSRKGLQ